MPPPSTTVLTTGEPEFSAYAFTYLAGLILFVLIFLLAAHLWRLCHSKEEGTSPVVQCDLKHKTHQIKVEGHVITPDQLFCLFPPPHVRLSFESSQMRASLLKDLTVEERLQIQVLVGTLGYGRPVQELMERYAEAAWDQP